MGQRLDQICKPLVRFEPADADEHRLVVGDARVATRGTPGRGIDEPVQVGDVDAVWN